jgi:CheY-like chemotaxis protein
MPLIRVVLADDHALVLEGLRSLLDAEEDICVVGTATNGEQVLATVRSLQPDVLVLDLQMPTLNGLTCLERIRAEGLPTKVLVLSAFYDGESMQSALENRPSRPSPVFGRSTRANLSSPRRPNAGYALIASAPTPQTAILANGKPKS